MAQASILEAADLQSHEHYIAACLSLAQEQLCRFPAIAEIAAHERQINLYHGVARLENPRTIYVLEEDGLLAERQARGKEAVARGQILLEHAAAGEGSRLMLGPKYFLNIFRELAVETIAHLMTLDAGEIILPEAVAAQLHYSPQEVLPLSLGTRHMLQLAFDLAKLAEELGESPREVLGRQHLLIVIAREMAARIEQEFFQWHFFGFKPSQVYFMVQESFHGLNLKRGEFFYDRQSPRRLHNHGQMVMQQAMDGQLFTLVGGNPREKIFHPREAVGDWLQSFVNKVSYNIEDLDYLEHSLDFAGLGLALELGEKGYHMVMEVVANNPLNPQKGGMLAYDPECRREVMIESFSLGEIKNEDIKYLNRNFNHYPQPWVSWREIGDKGLPMPIAVKDGFLYFQPVQGDINFLVNTTFFRRRKMNPIQNLKRPAALPLAINRMVSQDRQPGFKEFAQAVSQGKI